MNKWPINSIKSLLSPLKIQNANCVYSEAWRLGTVQQSHSIWEQKLFITLVDLDLMLRSLRSEGIGKQCQLGGFSHDAGCSVLVPAG